VFVLVVVEQLNNLAFVLAALVLIESNFASADCEAAREIHVITFMFMCLLAHKRSMKRLQFMSNRFSCVLFAILHDFIGTFCLATNRMSQNLSDPATFGLLHTTPSENEIM